MGPYVFLLNNSTTFIIFFIQPSTHYFSMSTYLYRVEVVAVAMSICEWDRCTVFLIHLLMFCSPPTCHYHQFKSSVGQSKLAFTSYFAPHQKRTPTRPQIHQIFHMLHSAWPRLGWERNRPRSETQALFFPATPYGPRGIPRHLKAKT